MDSWTTKSRTFRTFLLLMEIEPERIRARLRQARKEAGLSQAALAELLEVHKRSIENYENVRVPWDHLNEYARLTNRPTEWFLYGDAALPPEGQLLALVETVDHLTSDLTQIQERIAELEAR